jgi:4-amino-4-deoxy-L-arabinose transferase-like glycosyltransferase
VVRMLSTNDWVTSQFLSGPLNSYPVFFIAKFFSLFHPVSHLDVLMIARILLPLVAGSVAVFFVAEFTRIVSNNRQTALIAALLFITSQMILSISRFWYPDHYIILFVAITAWLSAKIAYNKGNFLVAAGLGIAFGAAVSVKYTAVLLLVAIGLAFVLRFVDFLKSSNSRGGWKWLLTAGPLTALCAGLTILLLHFSAILRPQEFLAAQAWNASNYANESPDLVTGVLAYSFVLFVLSLGLPGILGICSGVTKLVMTSEWLKLILLLALPITVVLFFGTKGHFINRNIMLAVPFVITIAAIGISWLLEKSTFAYGYFSVLVRIVVGVAFATQVVLVGNAVIQDFAPDSSVEAANWIETGIPRGVTVGTNDSCSGQSPAITAGMTTAVDPGMSSQYPYYVFNSYWPSASDVSYRDRNAAWSLLNQKYLHFYYYGDRNLPEYFPDIFAEPKISAPDGYEVIKWFRSNGPDIVVLKKLN